MGGTVCRILFSDIGQGRWDRRSLRTTHTEPYSYVFEEISSRKEREDAGTYVISRKIAETNPAETTDQS